MTLSPKETYNRLMALLEQTLTQTSINTWFDDAVPVDFTGDCFVLYTPTQFKKEVIENRYSNLIRTTLEQLFSNSVEFLVLSGDEQEAYRRSKDAPQVPSAPVDDRDEYTFDRFIVGASNRFAHAAAMAVANKPADVYNPLFIYGGSGLGKTHLLKAIASVIKKSNPSYNIYYLKGDDFINEMIDAIKTGSQKEFHTKYRSADVLLVDDIHYIAGKIESQNEFFHTFNSIYEAHKQIVLTSDRPPKEIYTLEERLRTRFEWGLPADIQSPDYETRMAIIKDKAERLGLELSHDLMHYIAMSITANVRQIEGTVKKILACRNLLSLEINKEVVTQVVRDMLRDNPGMKPTPNLIIDEVCKFYGIDPDMIRSQNRRKEVVVPRQVAMYLVRELTELSLPSIGREFGGRDHSTVISSINKIEEAMRTSPDMKNLVKDLLSNISER